MCLLLDVTNSKYQRSQSALGVPNLDWGKFASTDSTVEAPIKAALAASSSV